MSALPTSPAPIINTGFCSVSLILFSTNEAIESGFFDNWVSERISLVKFIALETVSYTHLTLPTILRV